MALVMVGHPNADDVCENCGKRGDEHAWLIGEYLRGADVRPVLYVCPTAVFQKKDGMTITLDLGKPTR